MLSEKSIMILYLSTKDRSMNRPYHPSYSTMVVSGYCVWAIETQNEPTEPRKLTQTGGKVLSEKSIMILYLSTKDRSMNRPYHPSYSTMVVSGYCVWAIETQNEPTEPRKLTQTGRYVLLEKCTPGTLFVGIF